MKKSICDIGMYMHQRQPVWIKHCYTHDETWVKGDECPDGRDRFTMWYDRQRFDNLVLIALSPLILFGLLIIGIAIAFGGK